MKEIIKTLNNIGLNKNQAKTYVTMLELGKASVIDICRVSGIARTTIYDNFRVLKSTGLATEVWEKGKKYFIAESPENIQKILEDKQKAVSGVITDLVKIFNVSKLKPRITIMNGKKGLIKMHQFSLIFNTNKRTRWLGEVDSLFSYLSEKFVKNYVKKRVEKGIRNQVLTTSKIFTRREMYSKHKNKENLR
jgi:sugar-specific transcriptional regulator TrmB